VAAQLTDPARHILEAAKTAHKQGDSERDFYATFDNLVLAQTPARSESIGLALYDAMNGGEWPWSTKEPVS
jgi:hypothetical protein